MLIYNLHERNPNNIGDMMSAPALYANTDKHNRVVFGHILNPDAETVKSADLVVIGGGGIARYPYGYNIIDVSRAAKKTVMWGVGIEDYNLLRWMKKGTILGTRGKNTCDIPGNIHDVEQVHCASCLHNVFDGCSDMRNRDDYGSSDPFYFIHQAHVQYINDLKASGKNVALNNFSAGLDEIVGLMMRAPYVVTTSFHGAYWAALCGKRCYFMMLNGEKAMDGVGKFNGVKLPGVAFVSSEEEIKKLEEEKAVVPDVDFLNVARTSNYAMITLLNMHFDNVR